VANGIGSVLKKPGVLARSGLIFKTAEEIRGYKD
jgi:hypothetical protein